ncbi:phage polarity suppression protein [Scandinavium sp. M-37]|uniref:phage polarity suppression protein n=1 Tax=Scandinavium sp. M-37 TaxID=3373077 RepID=UPI0037457115
MTTVTLQQAFEACQNNKTTWLNRKQELADAEQEYRELIATGDDSRTRSLQTLREIIDVKKWEMNQAAGRYIRSHENVQRISIRNRLNDFMQAHGAELAAALAPELMAYNSQNPAVTHCVMQHSVDYLREALSGWLAAGEKIHYFAQDNDILTAIGFRPDAASRDDNREKYTPAQNQNYVNKRAELAAQ